MYFRGTGLFQIFKDIIIDSDGNRTKFHVRTICFERIYRKSSSLFFGNQDLVEVPGGLVCDEYSKVHLK